MSSAPSTTALAVRRERNYLDAFLERYWFAPPVALWRSIEAHALSEMDFPAPMLDFGCGDGMFTEAIFGNPAQVEWLSSLGKPALREAMTDPTRANPDTVMPPFGRHRLLDAAEIERLVEFLHALP